MNEDGVCFKNATSPLRRARGNIRGCNGEGNLHVEGAKVRKQGFTGYDMNPNSKRPPLEDTGGRGELEERLKGRGR